MSQVEDLKALRDSYRAEAEQTGPTEQLAKIDANLTEAINQLEGAADEPIHIPVPPATPDPKDLEIADLRARIERMEQADDRNARDRLQAESAKTLQKPGHDVRPLSDRPRGLQRFQNGHSPPDPDEEDFVGRPPTLAEQQDMMPGQGGKRPLKQADIHGDGESQQLAHDSKRLLEGKIGREID